MLSRRRLALMGAAGLCCWVLFGLVIVGVASASVTVVQDQGATVATSPTVVESLPGPVAAGDGETLAVESVSGVVSVTSSNGDTWVSVGEEWNTYPWPGYRMDLFYVSSSAGGSPTVSITTAANESGVAYDLAEWPGALTLGSTSEAGLESGTVDPGPFSGSDLSVLAYGLNPAEYASPGNGTTTGAFSSWPPAGYSALTAVNVAKFAYEAGTSSPQEPTAGLTGVNMDWVGIGASFSVVAAATTTTTASTTSTTSSTTTTTVPTSTTGQVLDKGGFASLVTGWSEWGGLGFILGLVISVCVRLGAS